MAIFGFGSNWGGEEVGWMTALLDGQKKLIAKLPYGTGINKNASCVTPSAIPLQHIFLKQDTI